MNDVLRYTVNRYSDIVLDPTSLVEVAEEEFGQILASHVEVWRADGMAAVWMEIPMERSELIKVALEQGFLGHHCTDKYWMLTLWMGRPDDSKLPHYGTHIVRVEALLLREDPQRPGAKQVLVVREKYSQGKRGKDWKLLSGGVEPGEFIDQAIVREVCEEVGLSVRFSTVVGHGNRVSSTKFGRNEIFFVCHVVLVDHEEELKSDRLVLQEDELTDAKWMDVTEALVEWQTNYKLRGLERRCLLSALKNKGLVNFTTHDERGPEHRMLAHFVGVPPHELPNRRSLLFPGRLPPAPPSSRPESSSANMNGL